MKKLFGFLVSLILATQLHAQNKGICLFASSPETPNDQVQAIECVRAEKIFEGYRVFKTPVENVVITTYRFRGYFPYPAPVLPSSPEFQKQMGSLTKMISTYPATKPFLEPRLAQLQNSKQSSEAIQSQRDNLPSITVNGITYKEPKVSELKNRKLYLLNINGKSVIDIDKLSKLEFDNLQEFVKKSNLFTLEKPGFYQYQPLNKKYHKLVTPDGKFYINARIEKLDKENIIVSHEKGLLELPLATLYNSENIEKEDKNRLEGWVEKIIDFRYNQAPIRLAEENSVPLLLDDKYFTAVTIKIFQIVKDGAIISSFRGDLTYATQDRKKISYKEIHHPITNEKLKKVINDESLSLLLSKKIDEGLCFIEGIQSPEFHDGQVITIKRISPTGNYQYKTESGEINTIPSYIIDNNKK